MMLTMLLPSLFVLAAALAGGAMIATWRHYGGAWDGVSAQMRSGKPAPLRYVTVRVMSAERGLVPVPVRARSPADRSRHGRRAGA
jgi:hypothetical protein